MTKNEEFFASRTLSGYPVVVDPNDGTIRKLREKGFTGFTLVESSRVKCPWAVWSFGHIDCWTETDKEAQDQLDKKIGRKNRGLFS